MLDIDEATIQRCGRGNILAVCWRQWRAERALAQRGIHFRTTDPVQLARAYAAMTESDFEAINGRQSWANWRTIPRALNGRVPERPLVVVDLGCGTGTSTQVLTWYCPAGSQLIGYELAEPLLDVARRRSYRQCDGLPAEVSFHCQGVTEPFPLAERSVDLINASGVVGHHLDEQSALPLIQEIERVLKDDGMVTLDVGPTLGCAALTQLMAKSNFCCLGHVKSWRWDPTGQLIFKRESPGLSDSSITR